MGWLVALAIAAVVLIAIWSEARREKPIASSDLPHEPKPFTKTITIDADEAFRQRERALAGLQPPPRLSKSERKRLAKASRKYGSHQGARSRARFNSDPVGRSFLLEYHDADGVVTEREISVFRVRCRADLVYVLAFCSLREALREFRADRMLALTDGDTGAQISDPETFFARWASG